MAKKCKGCGTAIYKEGEKYCKKCAKNKLKEQLELNRFITTLDNEIYEHGKNCDMPMKRSKKGKKGVMKGYKQLGEASGDSSKSELKAWAYKWAKGYIKHNIVEIAENFVDDVHDEVHDDEKEAAIMKEMKTIATKIKGYLGTI
jgi:hypothetical protein